MLRGLPQGRAIVASVNRALKDEGGSLLGNCGTQTCHEIVVDFLEAAPFSCCKGRSGSDSPGHIGRVSRISCGATPFLAQCSRDPRCGPRQDGLRGYDRVRSEGRAEGVSLGRQLRLSADSER